MWHQMWCFLTNKTLFSSQKTFRIASNLGQCWLGTELYPCYTWSSLGWWGPSSQGLRCLHRSTMSPSYPALSRVTPSLLVSLFQSFPLSTWRWFANSCFQVPHNHNMSPFNNIKCYWEYLQTPISSDSRVLSQSHKINNPGWCSAMMSCYSYSLAASPCSYCPLPSLLHPLGSPVGGQRWAVGTPTASLRFITVININIMSKYDFCLIGRLKNWNIYFFSYCTQKLPSWQCGALLVWLGEDAQHLVMLPGPAQPSSMLVLSPDTGQTLIWL